MKPEDTITVLMCVHSPDLEHDDLLQRALESLVSQTYDKFNVIMVMDECWDGTESIVESYADVLDISYFKRPRKQGLAIAKNFGLGKCTADWICYLDADDAWMDCKLEVQRQYLLEHPDISFCGTNAWDNLDGVLRPNCFRVTDYQSHEEIVARLAVENIMCHGSMMIRRNALVSLNGYDTSKSYLGREDWELWARAVQAGFKFAKVPERLYIYSLGTGVVRGTTV